MLLNFIIFLILINFVNVTYSKDRLTNHFLREQIIDDPSRVLPRNNYFIGSVDGHLFFRPGQTSYYHGGYWIDNFIEISPNENLRFNGRVTLLNPAASYGVTSDSSIHHFLGVTWRDNLQTIGLFDADFTGIFFDLDRQTLGAGLTLQDKEMSGLLTDVEKGSFRFRFILDGTGGYNIRGDVLYMQIDWWDNLAGISAYSYEGGQQGFISLFSTHQYKHLGHFLEISSRNGAMAYLAGIEMPYKRSWLTIESKLQTRGYGKDYAKGIKRQIEQDYLSIEQEDKDFTDSMNIFVIDDDVLVHAAKVNVRVNLHSKFGLMNNNEFAVFDYNNFNIKKYYFYKIGLFLCPRANNNECGEVFYSNKMTAAFANPKINDSRNTFNFEKTTYLGLAARFKF